jgi:fibronectin-binding autotransporter adhesin
MSIGGGNIMYPGATYALITLYWDTNGTSVGATNTTTAAGTWGTNNYWTTDPAGLIATRSWISASDAVFSAGSNATGSFTVTVSGSQAVRNLTVRNGTITFSSGTLQIAPGAQWNNSTANLASVTASIRYTNTLTIKSGIWGLTSASSVGTGGLTIDGPDAYVYSGNVNSFGTGVLTLNNGKLSASDGTSRAFTAHLLISGSITLGDLTKTGTLSFGTNQSITNPVTITALSSVTFGANMTWNGNLLTFRGLGMVTDTSTVAAETNTGSIAIGDDTTFSGTNVGGNFSAGTQTALGSGAVTVNYGGLLLGLAFNPSNSISVLAGGSLKTANTANVGSGGSLAVSSLATVGGLTAGTSSFTINGNTWPTAGALFVDNTRPLVLNDAAYPTLTGTMMFTRMSTGTQSMTFGALNTGNAARTLGFSTAYVLPFTGITLNGDLTLVGTGNSGLYGFIPSGAGGGLGAVAQDANRNITLAMAPGGMVSVTGSTGGWQNTDLNSGTLQVNTTDGLGAGTFTINGGAFRAGTTISKDITVGPNGGAIEGSNTTYSGALTGSIALVARAVDNLLFLTGDNTNFTGGFTLASAGTPNTVVFTGTNALGGSGTITVPSGVSFGGTAVNTGGYANKARFSTTTNSIYDVRNINTAPDLSSAGLDKDVWVGLSNTAITAYTLPSSGNTTTYRVVPIAATTISTADVFTGANNLIISPGVVPTNSNSSMTSVVGSAQLTLSNSNNLSGSTTVQGTVTNSLMGGGVTGSSLRLLTSGELPNTSSITIDQNALFTVASGSNTGASGAPLVIKGGGSLSITTVTSPLRDNLALTLGGSSGGGLLAISFGSQTLASLTIGAGRNSISGTSILNITGGGGAGYTRQVGGVLVDTQATTYGTAPTAAGGSSVATGAGAGDAILIGATNGANFIAAATTFASPSYLNGNNLATWTTGKNIQITGAVSNTIGNNVTINSLNIISVRTLIFGAAGNVLNISSGMIHFSVHNSFIGNAVGNGVIRTANGQDLIISTSSSSPNDLLTINSKIDQEGGTAIRALVTSGARVYLTNSNNQIGDVYCLFGSLRVDAVGGLGDVTAARTIYLYGGSLYINHISATYTSTNIVVGPQGGVLSTTNTSGVGAIFQGSVTLSGKLSMLITGFPNIPAIQGFIELAGEITGLGSISMVGSSDAGVLDVNKMVVSGSNPNWSGGIYIAGVAATTFTLNFHLAKGASAGTGPIVSDGAGGSLYLDTNASADSTYTNDFFIKAPLNLAAWSLGPGLGTSGGTITTLTGKMFGTSIVNFQGYATSDTAITELVLSGPISLSGSARRPFANDLDGYDFGTTSVLQYFNNGPGGLSLGVTSTPNTYFSLPSGSCDQGALGFIRFANTQSFLLGVVGPGYISALHRATDTVDQTGRFGFLLTAMPGAGTTYQIPKGKSFLIGSLGAADTTLNKQIGGTFGTSSAAGAGNNFATLLGSPKYIAGQTLAGMTGGDINIHANAATDTQFLKLFVRHAGDTLTLGDGTPANQVIFCPTWGDSGGQSCITLMRKRTGGTTLTKVGAGTLTIADANYLHTDGTSARSAFTWNVTGGTLYYNDDDSGQPDFVELNVGIGSILGGSGVLKAPVIVVSGTVNPGNSITTAALTVNSLNFNNLNATMVFDLNGEIAGTQYDQLVIPSTGGGVTLNGATLVLVLGMGYSPAVGTVFTIIDRRSSGAIAGTFNGLSEGATVTSAGTNFTISYVGGDGNDITLTVL